MLKWVFGILIVLAYISLWVNYMEEIRTADMWKRRTEFVLNRYDFCLGYLNADEQQRVKMAAPRR